LTEGKHKQLHNTNTRKKMPHLTLTL